MCFAASLLCSHVLLAVTEGHPAATKIWDDVMVSVCAARRDQDDVSNTDAMAGGEGSREMEGGREGREGDGMSSTGVEGQTWTSHPAGGHKPVERNHSPPSSSCCQAM